MGVFKDKIGEEFGLLTIIGPVERRGTNTYWNCKCDCGNELYVFYGSLSRGQSMSCGCATGLAPNRYKIIHRESNAILKMIKQRCYNKNQERYKDYGAKGIYVCNEWLNDTYTFYKWFDTNYKKGATVHRKDNTGPYSPLNCEILTKSEHSKLHANLRSLEC